MFTKYINHVSRAFCVIKIVAHNLRVGPKMIPKFSKLNLKGRYTRGSLLLKHAPETRSRVSTPTSTHEGHDEAAE